jgi:acyl dehydratase
MSGTEPLPPLVPTLLHAVLTTFRRGRGRAMPLPRTYLVAPLEPGAAARYRELLGFAPGGAPPLTWHYLAAQRAQLALMTDSRFPFAVPGLVHLENLLLADGTPSPEASWLVEVAARAPVALPSGAVTFTLEAVLRQSEGATVRCESTYLGRRGQGRTFEPSPPEPPRAWEEVGRWDLGPAVGRRYATLSGDWNPIHLHPLAGRLFGFGGTIAHGMYLAGLALAALERAEGRPARSLAVRFRRPVALPAPGLVCERAGADFRLRAGEVKHATGTWVGRAS